ncbi:CRE-PEPT-1 protein [Caenorhabditis remanei]|uniref:Oligopeptide transporter 1 n=1 Tax=Caenorhabditis remanei TaxID=31234 RepID=E3LDH9_CAERE|nr:CRE-PEPT-1 protein [Caenorhabditis remanei]
MAYSESRSESVSSKGQESKVSYLISISGKKSYGHELETVPLPEKKIYTTWPDMIRHWPKTTLCIVSNEFCERFSYYGMRTVLTFYLLNVLKFTDSQSTIFFNGFTVLCYTTPLLGSIVADGYIGKFWTIFSVSILYAIGQVVLALASIKNYQSSVHPWMDLSGLLIIAFGTGGIKPCVSAFGGDQFELGQERMLSLFFSMFYFSINAGSMISTFISPIFRSQPCLGQDSCYPMAFGIPAILMIVATLVFMGGSFWYKKNPPKDNVFGEVSRLMFGAVGNKMKKGSTPKEHWLLHYLTTHDCALDAKCLELQAEKRNKKLCQKKKFIDDVRSLLRVLVMFLPVPMFWALYDQQGSVWLLQAIQMDCRLSDSLLLLPDQMQTLNAVLILAFIPLFQVIIYPVAAKCVRLTPLRKMVTGGLLASLAFLITGFVQLQVNTTLPNLPGKGQCSISFWNQFNNDFKTCQIIVTDPNGDKRTINQSMALHENKDDKAGVFKLFQTKSPNQKSTSDWTLTFKIAYAGNCGDPTKLQNTAVITAKSKKVIYVGVGPFGYYQNTANTDKPTDGTGEFSMGIVANLDDHYAGNFAMCRSDASDYDRAHPCNPRHPADFYFWETDYNDGTDDREGNSTVVGSGSLVTTYKQKSVKPGKWELYYLLNTPKDINRQTYNKTATLVQYTNFNLTRFEQGGVFIYALSGPRDSPYITELQIVQNNRVSILWQIPQIVVITAAEILFSITGYEFAYSQSAPSMKALVQALWLLTTAAGDTIIVIITILNLFENMAVEFFVYAAAMFVVIAIFALLSIFYYTYNYYTTDEDDDEYGVDDMEEEVAEIEDHNPRYSIDNKAFNSDEADCLDVRF